MGIGAVRRLLRTKGTGEDLHGRLSGGLRAKDGGQEVGSVVDQLNEKIRFTFLWT